MVCFDQDLVAHREARFSSDEEANIIIYGPLSSDYQNETQYSLRSYRD